MEKIISVLKSIYEFVAGLSIEAYNCYTLWKTHYITLSEMGTENKGRKKSSN